MNEDYQNLSDELQDLNLEFKNKLTEKEKLLLQTNQKLSASNRCYSELLNKYQTEKEKNNFPWKKAANGGIMLIVILGIILSWRKIRFLIS